MSFYSSNRITRREWLLLGTSNRILLFFCILHWRSLLLRMVHNGWMHTYVRVCVKKRREKFLHTIYTCARQAQRMFHYYDRKYLPIGDRPSNLSEKPYCENMKCDLQITLNTYVFKMFKKMLKFLCVYCMSLILYQKKKKKKTTKIHFL